MSALGAILGEIGDLMLAVLLAELHGRQGPRRLLAFVAVPASSMHDPSPANGA
jgi:hypothetical protein